MPRTSSLLALGGFSFETAAMAKFLENLTAMSEVSTCDGDTDMGTTCACAVKTVLMIGMGATEQLSVVVTEFDLAGVTATPSVQNI